MPRLLSLFDATGNWSRPYTEAGWEVTRVDLSLGIDILEWTPPEGQEFRGVLAAPPCTHFANSGAQYWREKDLDGRTAEGLLLIYRTLALIDAIKPAFWCLENPVGRLPKLVPALARFGPQYFQPCWYGDPYTKKTGLWGRFNFPRTGRAFVPPSLSSVIERKMSSGSPERSATPLGFAYAFFEVNQ